MYYSFLDLWTYKINEKIGDEVCFHRQFDKILDYHWQSAMNFYQIEGGCLGYFSFRTVF